MANIQSAIKRARQSERRRLRNRRYNAAARTYVKKARRLIDAGELEEAEDVVKRAIRALDKAASKGVIHQNNAARRKSRLVKHLHKAQEA